MTDSESAGPAKQAPPGFDATAVVMPERDRPTSVPKPKPHLIQNRVVRLTIIVVMSVFCIASASCHTLFAQPFKQIRDPGAESESNATKFDSPLLFAIVTSGSFPIAFLFWLISCRGRIVAPSWRQWRSFAVLALPESANIICSSLGLSKLNATEYAIIRGTSLIFVVGLSKIMTHKKFNLWQYGAVLMMTVALCLVGFNPDAKKNEIDHGLQHWFGFGTAVAGSVFVSILSVLTQKLFATEQSKGDLTFICQINTCQSFLSTLIVLPVFLFKEFDYVCSHYPQVAALGMAPTFWGLLAGMWVASPLMLFTNIGLTSFSSATFSRSLGGPKRVVCIVLGHYIFGDGLNGCTITAAVLLFISLGVYIYGGHLLQVSKSSKQRTKL